MPAEINLQRLLATLSVRREPGVFVLVSVPAARVAEFSPRAMVREAEGTSIVIAREEARAAGIAFEFEAAWLTLEVHSALEAVGLTHAFAGALGARGIPANVLAGFYHDHILVPAARADEAIAAIEALRDTAQGAP